MDAWTVVIFATGWTFVAVCTATVLARIISRSEEMSEMASLRREVMYYQARNAAVGAGPASPFMDRRDRRGSGQ